MNNKKRFFFLTGITIIFAIIVMLIITYGGEKNKTVKVGLVVTGGIDEPGWNRQHYEGLVEAGEGLNIEFIVKENVEEYTGKCEAAVKELIAEGAELIVLSSMNYEHEIRDLINDNEDISFYCCSSSEGGENTSTYFVRMYQARYLSGIIAGMQTENGKLGYVAAMPSCEVNRGINAFTLGAQSVRPDAQVYVVWTGSWDNEEKERKAVATLAEGAGVDLVTYHQNQSYVVDEAEKYGIYSIGYHEYMDGYSNRYLTAVTESWKNVYDEILREYMQGRGNSSSLIWPGLEMEAVGLTNYSELVSEEVRKKVETQTQRMINGWDVFSGVIVSADGEVRCQDREAISDDIIFGKMDWLVKGVIEYEN